MFERLTDRGRRVFVLAQEEARMLSHTQIGTEHLLLGLLREGEGVAAAALDALGVTLEIVRTQVEEMVGRGDRQPSGHMPFTATARRVLELASGESEPHSDTAIDTEELLLGIFRNGEGTAVEVLTRLGVDLNVCRGIAELGRIETSRNQPRAIRDPYNRSVHDQLITRLLPILVHRAEAEFNLFEVLHHGTHEKQLSNLFAWLLDAQATHRLGETFQRLFIDEVNRALPDSEAIPAGSFGVRQEVNTSASSEGMDIADIVLENADSVLVIENYYTSDGHGHGFDRYMQFAARDAKRGVVVMLCGTVNLVQLSGGWEQAAVVTYSSLVQQLVRHIQQDDRYQCENPQQCLFFDQMHKHFVGERQMNDDELIRFVDAMCSTGEAERFRQGGESAALIFADHLREQALDQFKDSRGLLQRVKATLKNYCTSELMTRVNTRLDGRFITDVSANYQGIYQWTINFAVSGEDAEGEAPLQLKFGPSAWFANEKDGAWTTKVPHFDADYTRLFLTRVKTKEIWQSAVSLEEVLGGLSPDDSRLEDEIVSLVRQSG